MSKVKFKGSTPREVRRTLIRVINLVANYELDARVGNTIILGCNAILSSIRLDEQEKRIQELEKRINDLM